jgi:hypothetical protein
MKEETQQSQGNTGNHGGGVFSSGRKWALGAKKGIETALCQRKADAGLGKCLATCCEGRESRKRPTLVVGKKPNGKSRLNKTKKQKKVVNNDTRLLFNDVRLK